MDIPSEQPPADSFYKEAKQFSGFPSPNDPPWNSAVAFGVWFVSVCLVLLVPVIFLVPYLISSGQLQAESEELAKFAATDPTSILIQIAAIVPVHLVTFALCWAVVTRFKIFSFKEMVGWSWGGVRWWHYALILCGFFVLAGITSNFFPESENQLIRILKSSRAAVFVVAFMATFTAPLVEEVVYRGILYSAFQRTFGVTPAVIGVTLLFTLVHVPQYLESPSTIVLLSILSLTLTLLRVYSGSLLPCVIFHTLVNGIQSAILIAEPYIRQTVPTDAAPAAFLPF